MYTKEEQHILETYNTPSLIEEYLDSLRFDSGILSKYTVRSFRRTISDQKGNCLSMALTGGHIMEHNGKDPLILDLKGEHFGHVVGLYDEGKIGSFGRSSIKGCGSMPAKFDSVEELARYYAEVFRSVGEHIWAFGEVDLRKLEFDWVFSKRNLNSSGICNAINKFRHYYI